MTQSPAHVDLLPAANRLNSLMCFLLAALLIGSWLIPITHEWWRALDHIVFVAISGSIQWGFPWPELWAATSDQRFDLFCSVLIFSIFYARWLNGHEVQWRQGITFGLYTLVVTLITVSTLMTPGVVLAMCLITWLWWQAGGHRLGLIAAGLTLLLVLPRLATGSQQVSDILVSAVACTLLVAGFLQLPPLNGWMQQIVHWLASGVFCFKALIERRFGHPTLASEPMGPQIMRGICMGIADLIPGVSGGTMALILGIYQRLLNAIASVNRDFIKLIGKARLSDALRHIDILFVLPLGIGILVAIAFFSRVIPIGWLIRELPEATFGLFFGLISASVVSLLLSVKVTHLRAWLWWLAGLGGGLFVVMLVPAQTPSTAWFIFICGAVAATAMLLPGVSGSFVLLVLGKYAEVLEALASLNMAFILPLLAGIATGAIAFASSISWLLANYYQRTMLTVIGVLTGSLLAVWPYQHWLYEEVDGKQRLLSATPYFPQHIDTAIISGIVMMIVGVFLYRGIEKLASKAS